MYWYRAVVNLYWTMILGCGKTWLKCCKYGILATAIWLLPNSTLLSVKDFWIEKWAAACSPWSGNYRYIKSHWGIGSGNYHEFIGSMRGENPHRILGSNWHRGMVMAAISEILLDSPKDSWLLLVGLNDLIIVSWMGCWLSECVGVCRTPQAVNTSSSRSRSRGQIADEETRRLSIYMYIHEYTIKLLP